MYSYTLYPLFSFEWRSAITQTSKKKKLLITKSSPHLLKGIAILLKIICGYCCKVLQLKDICKATVSP